MSQYRGIIMFLVALLAAAGAVVMAAKWLNARSAQVDQVAVAIQDINMGQKLTPGMFKLVNWPVGNMPEGAFSDISLLENRVTKSTLSVGEPVLASKLAPEGSTGGLSAVIAEGKRAITVRVNDVVGVAGFALPGNYVDIIVNTKQEEGTGNKIKKKEISKIILEKILVLAVAQQANRDETKPKVVNAVTLEVSPQQAEMIDLARSVGDLSLVLRNQTDLLATQTDGITKQAMLDIPAPMPAVVQPETKIVVKKVYVKPKRKVQKPVVQKQCTKVITGLSESLECF